MAQSTFLFTEIMNQIDNYFSNIGDTAMNNIVNNLLFIVGSYMLCWIMYRGYKILWGKSNDNIKDFLWDMFLKIIFIYICLFPNDWLGLVKEAIEGFRKLYDDGISITEQINEYYKTMVSFSTTLIITNVKVPVVGDLINFLYLIVIWLTFLVAIFGITSALIINTIVFYILLLITPLAFYFLIFGNFLRSIFIQWFQMVLSNVLTLLFIKFFAAYGINQATQYIHNLTNQSLDKVPDYKIILYCCMTAIFLKAFISIIISLAEKLTNVSLEASGMNAMKSSMGSIGAASGLGAMIGKMGVKSTGKIASGVAKGSKAIYDKLKGKGGKE